MLPARRYWARFLLYGVLGLLVGLLAGLLVEAFTRTSGWDVFAATAGLIAGVVAFMLRDDT
ncbi:MAG TPA: hypothetical protein VMP03_12920 [Methylomirabilota bacterium]|nr:hypothetical protein [Methylomirabilota bacterium]